MNLKNQAWLLGIKIRRYFMCRIDSVMTAEEMAKHLKWKSANITPLRLQKSLYFLFAFYGASYGKINNEDGIAEDSYPKYLFEGKFEAWQYGPVDRDIYSKNKKGELVATEWEPKTEKDRNVLLLIDEVLEAVNQLGDFELVERSHQDLAWQKARTPLEDKPQLMNNDLIIEDYVTEI